MVPSVNKKTWAAIEYSVRSLIEYSDDVYVVTGPLYVVDDINISIQVFPL